MNELIKDVGKWSEATFGEGDRTLELFSHLKEEADEAIDAYKSGSSFETDESFADCFIVLFDAMHRRGLSWEKLMVSIKAKMEVNKHKTWDGR